MPLDDHKRGVRESALQKTRPDQVGGRLLQQKVFGQVPVGKPLCGQLRLILHRQQLGLLGQVRLGSKGELAGSSPINGLRIDRLQILAFIFRGQPFIGVLVVGKAADGGMLAQHPEQQRGAAPVQPAQEHEMVRLDDFLRLPDFFAFFRRRERFHDRFRAKRLLLHS